MTTTEDLTDVQRRKLKTIQDLLAKAEDEGATPEEAEALTAKAAYLLAEYGIDAALANARRDVRETPVDRSIYFAAPYAKQHSNLFYNILRIFGGEAVIMSRPTRGRASQDKGITLHVYAFEADLMVVDVLYTSLLLQATTQLAYAEVPEWESARSYRVGWWIGFTSEVIARVKDAYAKAEVTAEPGTAIVLRDRALEVKDRFRADHPSTRRVAGSSTRSEEGYSMGRWAGRTADIHSKANVGQSGRTALG